MTLAGAIRSAVCCAALAVLASSGPPVRAQAPLAVETFDAAWRIVRDSHFDRTMNGLDWEAVGREFRPQAAAAGTPGELRRVIRGMLERLELSHFDVIPASADTGAERLADGGGTPGFDVRPVGGDLLVTAVDHSGAAAAAGVRAGWKVRTLAGRSVPSLVAAAADGVAPRLLQHQIWRLAQARLRGAPGSRLDVTFEDGAGRTVALALERRQEPGERVTVGNLPTMAVRVHAREVETPAGGRAGLVGFNVWMAAVDAPFQRAIDAFRNADGIIVDLRGNPGGLAAMLMGISGHFISERKAIGVMTTREGELRFNVNPRRVDASGGRVEPYAGPVAILVDALSASASECFAGGMQSLQRARVFGTRSMGQALPALFDRLPNGDVLIHAYGDFVTADGTRLEGRGVIPDEEVPLERSDLLAGRDRTLEAALAWIDRVRVGPRPGMGGTGAR